MSKESSIDAIVELLCGPEKYPRRGGPCNHRSCHRSEEGCRAYVTVTSEDDALAQQLVADGWWSTSRRYCTIARWREAPPSQQAIEAALIAAAGEFHGKRLAEYLVWHRLGGMRATAEQLETRTITPSQMTAFKKAGGDCARL